MNISNKFMINFNCSNSNDNMGNSLYSNNVNVDYFILFYFIFKWMITNFPIFLKRKKEKEISCINLLFRIR